MQSPIDYSKKWYVMGAVSMGVFLATIDSSIVNVALPTLTRVFDTEFATVQWIVLAYLLTVTTLMLSVGRLADMIGKKPLYNAGFVVFTVGSILCGLSPNVYALIGFRVLQALGASMTMALGTAIVTEAFPPSERGKALGISGAVVSVGIVLGPTLGGLLIDALSWRWIFYVNLPIGVVGTLLVRRFVPATKPAGGQRFDYPGAATLFVSLLALLLALTWGQRSSFSETRILTLFAISAIFCALFFAIEFKSAQPMIDLRLFRNRLFSINLITGFFTFVSIAGSLILMPFFLENVLGYGPRTVGLLLAVVPIGLGLTAPVSGTLSDRFGTRPITVIGLLVLLVGYFSISTLNESTSALGYLVRFLPIGIGMGIFQSPNNSAIMGSAPRESLGVASGLLAITRTLGQTTGIAILGALWASRVAFHAGGTSQGGATDAPASAQVAGLHDTFLVVILLISIGLALAIWGLVQERRGRRVTSLTAQPPHN
jgi:EmrB/QacA subfamily drug resistance transporter